MSNTTTIGAFLDAIAEKARAHFGGRVAYVGVYDPQDPLTDERLSELQYDCSLWAICWLSHYPDDPPALADDYADAVAALVLAVRETDAGRRGNRWGLADAVSYPKELEIGEGVELNGRSASVVRWEQTYWSDGSLPA